MGDHTAAPPLERECDEDAPDAPRRAGDAPGPRDLVHVVPGCVVGTHDAPTLPVGQEFGRSGIPVLLVGRIERSGREIEVRDVVAARRVEPVAVGFADNVVRRRGEVRDRSGHRRVVPQTGERSDPWHPVCIAVRG